MMGRARRTAFGLLAALVACAGARQASRSSSVRAAYRAFRDPSLVDRPPAPEAPVAVSCAGITGDGKTARYHEPADVDLSRAFDRPIAEDLDDPEGATIRSLTLPDLRVPITRRTMRFVRFLTKTEAGRAAFLKRHRRAALYRESIAFELREAGLPEDLLWLAAVESAFDPRAVSPAGAGGLWQLMPETAQLYGLEQSRWVDERRSIVRSTHAAVTHLRDLYERFGRWDLALAAYNAGYDRVAGAMEKLARARGPEHLDDKPIEFADLAAARALPEETINYVPQIMAFALCAANRSRFGLDAPELEQPLEIGEIAVPEGTRLRTVARAAGVSIAVLRDYNPQLLRDRVPPIGGDYLVALPESRVPRALASFPSYSDAEVVAQNDGEDPEGTLARGDSVPALAADLPDDAADEPLPRRPVPLGHNRLPELIMPGHERVLSLAASLGVGMIPAKLPATLVMPDLGFRRLYSDDPLGLFGGGHRSAVVPGRTDEAAIDRQLGFLEAPPVEALHAVSLPGGVTVRVRRDKGAATTAITVRIATVEDGEGEGSPLSPFRQKPRGADAGVSETLHTITVDKGDGDAAIELAATRLRLALGGPGATELTEIRTRAGEARRKALQAAPYGQEWLALGDALFPPDHPLAGTVLGAGQEGGALREMLIAEAMRRERSRARASLTVVGDIDEARAQKLAEAFLATVGAPAEVPVPVHPREDRITVEDEVLSPRVLVGWIGPGEGEVGDASLRVAIEMLENPKVGLLQRALVRGGLCSLAHAGLEVWPRAGVASVELAPNAGHEVAEVLRALDGEIDRLAGKGPEGNEVAVAKFLVHARAQKEVAQAAAPVPAGPAAHSAALVKLRHALRPGAAEHVAKALEEVTATSVRNAVRRFLSREHRVVVTTIPRAR